MDKREVVEVVRQFADVIRDHFPVRQVILYGSYAQGNPREHSDIDVAVVIDNIEDDILTAEAKLFKLRRSIDLRIEPLLFEKGRDKSGFLEAIVKHGEVIYNN